jgi:hypothetical protein
VSCIEIRKSGTSQHIQCVCITQCVEVVARQHSGSNPSANNSTKSLETAQQVTNDGRIVCLALCNVHNAYNIREVMNIRSIRNITPDISKERITVECD